MTDPRRIRALISRIEADHTGREESDEYLRLTGWDVHHKTIGQPQYAIGPDGDKFMLRDFHNRPHPLANAQDALDSLPGGEVGERVFSDALEIMQVEYMGTIKELLAKTICLATLRRLEGG